VIGAFKRLPHFGVGTANLVELVHMPRRDERVCAAREEEDRHRPQARHEASGVPYLVPVRI
jgi:hypothetical protein